jgi:hypothetical protein
MWFRDMGCYIDAAADAAAKVDADDASTNNSSSYTTTASSKDLKN